MPKSNSQNNEDHETELDPLIEDLCKPIKDLHQDFENNISERLSKFRDLIHTKVEINGETVNFSQAAMMIQGTVGCYGKKVDFLHQHSLEILNMIGKDKALASSEAADRDKRGGSGPGGGRSRTAGNADFVFLDLEISSNIDKKDQDIASLGKKLEFIAITPRELMEKECQEHSINKVDLYYGPNYELLGAKKDFKMNSQFSMATSMFGDRLVVSVEEAVDCRLDVTIENENYQATQSQATRHPTLQPEEALSTSQHHDPLQYSAEPEDFCPVFDETSHNGQLDISVEREEIAAAQIATRAMRSRDNVINVDDLDVIVSEDEVETCNIYEKTGVAKPVKPGIRYKLPQSMVDEKREHIPSILDFLSNRYTETMKVSEDCQFLAESIHAEQLRRKEFFKSMKKQRLPASRCVEEPEGNDDCFNLELDEENDEHPDLDNVDQIEENEDEQFEPIPAFEFPDPHLGGEIGPVLDFNEEQRPEDGVEESYESLVNRKVNEYVQKSQAWVASTELARKVNSWHELIAPRLELVEERAAFDVNVYGSRILDSFASENRKVIKRFGDIVQGQPKEEVARFFLSSLMLANCHNVEICSEGRLNDLKLRFLTNRRHHEELEEFQPASQQTQDCSSTQSSQNKRRRI